MSDRDPGGAGAVPRRLRVYTLGFARAVRVRRILALAGWPVGTGWPGRDEAVGVWGRRPAARRGQWVATRTGVPLVTVEDGFLRSVLPGATGEPPLSLVIDDVGIYHDASAPSRLERLLEEGDLAGLRARAEAGIAALRAAGLSKYNPPPADPAPEIPEGHVLVVDQTAGDASIAGAGAGPETFAAMLAAARAEHPGAPLVVKSHPDVALGLKRGHFCQADLRPGEIWLDASVSPWPLLDRARAVYTVSSQLGYEAVLASRPVRCFGMAFYTNWGLTEDERREPRRTARRSVAELFAAAHLLYPVYYDPWRDCLTGFEETVENLRVLADAARPEPSVMGEAFTGVRLWKRRAVAAFRPPMAAPPVFRDRIGTAGPDGRRTWVWASTASTGEVAAARAAGARIGMVEDGFLRSRGLGAQLTEPISLVFDRTGIYFDPSGPSDLEAMLAGPPPPAPELARAARLRKAIVTAGVSKYNTGGPSDLPRGAEGQMCLVVPGQVEDDASILCGCGAVRTNLALLEAARAAHADAWLIYKPHPDVETGLRRGAVPEAALSHLADHVARRVDPVAALSAADRVWTMTSLLGFEALLRGVAVTCLGTPFYAGWGLTEDRGEIPGRRGRHISLDHLVWAALIAYPAYRDPVTGLPCPPEVAVERLASGVPGRRAGLLSRLQGAFAGQSWLWRRG